MAEAPERKAAAPGRRPGDQPSRDARLSHDIDKFLDDEDHEGAARAAIALGEIRIGEGQLDAKGAYSWALGLGIPSAEAQEVATHLERAATWKPDAEEPPGPEPEPRHEAPEPKPPPAEPRRTPAQLFLSYLATDASWAAWIARQLDAAGYVRAPDHVVWPEGEEESALGSVSVETLWGLVVVSPESAERTDLLPDSWMQVLPIRVGEVEPPSWGSFVDLVGLDEEAARVALLTVLQERGLKPAQTPSENIPPVPFPTGPRGPLDINARAYSDLPSEEDVLGFEPVVAGLDALLNDDKTKLPLAVALTAPWGAGKSSIMIQLARRLRARKEEAGARRWHVVMFEAWKYERSEQLWAALAKAIHDQPQKEMSVLKRVWFRVRLERRRQSAYAFLAKGLWPLVAALGALALASVTGLSGDAEETGKFTIAGLSLTALLATLGRYWGIVSNPFKRAIDGYVDRTRYSDQLGFTAEADDDIKALAEVLAPDDRTALAIFVDDLDRCSTKHVVEVVEAINQIFNSDAGRRCVFLLGMDREVVAAAIDVAYGETIGYLKERQSPLARSFGIHFLAKIVQMSVAVPEPDDEALERLLALVTGHPVSGEPDVDEALVKRHAGVIASEAPSNPVEVADIVRRREEDPAMDERDRRALAQAERRVRAGLFNADSDDVAAAEFEALRYLGRNPRQVKRFDNAFRLQLHVANGTPRSQLDFRLDQLVALGKWVAVRLRWPELAPELDRDPELITLLERAANDGAPSNDVPPGLEPTYQSWLNEEDLLKILREENRARRISALPLHSFLRVA